MERNTQLIGQSTSFLDAVERASRAAALDRPVLVIGERGTGKELVAERLHRLSPRWDGPLVTMNCAALPETLIEAELFGHEAGSFTGATKARVGRFEKRMAERSSSTNWHPFAGGAGAAAPRGRIWRGYPHRREQARSGRRAHRRRHQRASPKLVDENRFRADLLDRLCFEVVTLPPLRHRSSDIPVLADHFARRMALELEWDKWPGFSNAASARLLAYDWPGNVRELRNVVERAVYRWEDQERPIDSIQFDPFESPWRPFASNENRTEPAPSAAPALAAPFPMTSAYDPSGCADFRLAVAEYEKAILKAALEKCRWNQRAAAAALQLSYDQLRHALRRHEMMAVEAKAPQGSEPA
jgi:psp operon transcriptional activator